MKIPAQVLCCLPIIDQIALSESLLRLSKTKFLMPRCIQTNLAYLAFCGPTLRASYEEDALICLSLIAPDSMPKGSDFLQSVLLMSISLRSECREEKYQVSSKVFNSKVFKSFS